MTSKIAIINGIQKAIWGPQMSVLTLALELEWLFSLTRTPKTHIPLQVMTRALETVLS